MSRLLCKVFVLWGDSNLFDGMLPLSCWFVVVWFLCRKTRLSVDADYQRSFREACIAMLFALVLEVGSQAYLCYIVFFCLAQPQVQASPPWRITLCS